eukprot:3981555-Amphidinium_carterae.1
MWSQWCQAQAIKSRTFLCLPSLEASSAPVPKKKNKREDVPSPTTHARRRQPRRGEKFLPVPQAPRWDSHLGAKAGGARWLLYASL